MLAYLLAAALLLHLTFVEASVTLQTFSDGFHPYTCAPAWMMQQTIWEKCQEYGCDESPAQYKCAMGGENAVQNTDCTIQYSGNYRNWNDRNFLANSLVQAMTLGQWEVTSLDRFCYRTFIGICIDYHHESYTDWTGPSQMTITIRDSKNNDDFIGSIEAKMTCQASSSSFNCADLVKAVAPFTKYIPYVGEYIALFGGVIQVLCG
ncbi:hypothetical protein HDU83_009913 [Entophlyctis luteolus]|nr:hypothetical protein HDU83_009913 [Entophlyctis luteolus]